MNNRLLLVRPVAPSFHARMLPIRGRIHPGSPEHLRAWLRLAMGVEVPFEQDAVTGTGPLAYLWYAFHEPDPRSGPKPDAVVWACRGGGKTFYAALATALDLVFKPGIEVKTLGGSLEQSQRLHAHLRRFFESAPLRSLVDGTPTDRRLRLINGSSAETLAQSHTSVRGTRPHKLRCDEAELFDEGVWAAAQLAPRSQRLRGGHVHASIEALSTCHRPHGLMSRLIGEARTSRRDGPRPDHTAPRRLFKWGVIDVLENCPPERDCHACPLLSDCRSRAKVGIGHVSIDDAIRMRGRVSASRWESEMLCLRPRRDDCVYEEFDESIHVRADHPGEKPPIGSRAAETVPLGGMDFGFRSPTVFLWAMHDPSLDVLHVIDEHAASRLTLEQHLKAIEARGRRRPVWVGIDPAGRAAEAQSGLSHAEIMRRHGFPVRARRCSVAHGIELVRARLAPASGGAPRLFIHPRCVTLIESLVSYHYPPASDDSSDPVKDGPDHAADALRYLVTNLDARHGFASGNYLKA